MLFLYANQIGAAAFMEAGNAATNGGAGGAKRRVVSMTDHGRRDTGFIRSVRNGCFTTSAHQPVL